MCMKPTFSLNRPDAFEVKDSIAEQFDKERIEVLEERD